MTRPRETSLRPWRAVTRLALLVPLFLFAPALRAADEYEQPPIEYSRSVPANAVSRLQARLDEGSADLRYDDRFGYLTAVLEALGIGKESQTLVFSKTSLQRNRIAPKTPRAIYFGDDSYVGYCHEGNVLELSTADPQLGTVFYTLSQEKVDSPRFVRQTDDCLLCHGMSQTDGVPGHRVRSLFVDSTGLPLLAEGSHRVDHTTPFENRWGGWYVTGTHGKQTHLGNLVVRSAQAPRPILNDAGQNVRDLSRFFPVEDYLTPHSDLVALMVLEHQAMVHNLITKANFETRQALHYEAALNRALGEPPDRRRDSTTRRIESVGNALLEGLLLSREAPLTDTVAGSTNYAELFSRRGPRDRQGRSLRDFDLKTRMFKHPCSHLIDSAPFDGLPDEVRNHVTKRLHDVLTGVDTGKAFAHLTAEDRKAILEILTETKPSLWENVGGAE